MIYGMKGCSDTLVIILSTEFACVVNALHALV